MPRADPDRLRAIKTLPQLVAYLRDDLDWPIDQDAVEDDLTFDYQPEELGITAESAVAIKEIKQIRPLDSRQPWGVFWVNFEKKRLSAAVMRKVLRALVKRRRQQPDAARRATWEMDALLFVCSHRQNDQDALSFVHFAQPRIEGRAARLTSFGWAADSDNRTVLEFNLPALRWPEAPAEVEAWHKQWLGAFDVEKVTRQFFREIANWYFWALQHVRFPKDAPKEKDGRDHISVIRLITRLMFCWFVKQKGLIRRGHPAHRRADRQDALLHLAHGGSEV